MSHIAKVVEDGKITRAEVRSISKMMGGEVPKGILDMAKSANKEAKNAGREAYEGVLEGFGISPANAKKLSEIENKIASYQNQYGKITQAQDTESIIANLEAERDKILGLAQGGYVEGPGTSTSDSIPARLSKGEYVVNAKSTKMIGKENLDKINKGEKDIFG